MEKTKEEIWAEAMKQIQTQVPDISYQTWFVDAAIVPVDIEQNVLYLLIPNNKGREFIGKIIVERYLDLVTNCVCKSAGKEMSVQITSDLSNIPKFKKIESKNLNIDSFDIEGKPKSFTDSSIEKDMINAYKSNINYKTCLERIAEKLAVEKELYYKYIQSEFDDYDEGLSFSHDYFEGYFDGLGRALCLLSDYSENLETKGSLTRNNEIF